MGGVDARLLDASFVYFTHPELPGMGDEGQVIGIQSGSFVRAVWDVDS